MEPSNEPIKLKLDEKNSLTFEVTIKGEAPMTPVYRLVCEADDISYAFNGSPSDGGVEFNVPALQGKLREGTYDMHLEVIIDSKLLIPIQFKSEFGVSTHVTVESVQINNNKAKHDQHVIAAAKLVNVSTPKKQKIENAQVKQPIKEQRVKKQLTLKELHKMKRRGTK